MRPLALVLALTIMTSGLASAADANATGKQAAEFAKRVTLAVQAAKTKNGQFPASVPVVVNGKSIDVKVQVTPLAEGYSIKAQPAVDAKAGCPLESCNIDVNSDKSGVTIVSLVGTAADGSDIVAFATTGTELAVTVTQGDQTTTMTTTTAAADVPAQAGEAVAAVAPAAKPDAAPAATTAAKPATALTAPNDAANAGEAVGKVVKSDGVKATVTHAGKASPATAGTALAIGDVVKVAKADAKSPLALDLFDGASVSLSSGAELTIVNNDADPVIALGSSDKDAKYDATIDSGVLTQIGRHLVVMTPSGTVRTVGTQYSIQMTGQGAKVKVSSGSITLSSPQFPGVSLTVGAGQELKVVGNTATVIGGDGKTLSTTTVQTVNGVTSTSTTTFNADGTKTIAIVTGNEVVTTSYDVSNNPIGEPVVSTVTSTVPPVTQVDHTITPGNDTTHYDSGETNGVDVFAVQPPAGSGSGFILSIDASPTNTPASPE